MEISAVQPQVPQPSTQQASAPQAPREATVLPRAETVQEAPKTPKVDDKPKKAVQATDQERFEMVQQAATMFKDVFAVSDTKFTIFKDSSGQFITRFTNLRDGRVTYIPEPDILAYMESRSAQREALLQIDA